MVDSNRYSWINDQAVYGGFTLTIADGVNEDDVIALYGGDPSDCDMMTFEESFNMHDGTSPDRVRTLTAIARIHVANDRVDKETVVIAIENNGWAALDVARNAKKGQFFTVYRGGQGRTVIIHTADGHTLADFEPTLMINGTDVGGIVPEWAHTAEWRPGAITTTALSLAGKVMRVDIAEEWFTKPAKTTVTPS
ncbi:hypothetical protein [Alloactinosynnema sp. L-07]|uniref:hypothetical protein n=1 Tax=Alloactinosynnema sp. L-07 TaxID=1653480 RepID=UPI00065F07AB|nr:hypothetical protein [Alloactinosynnema sp. L-07]CRK60181.1 hypothetical protein [Alloactinosynnema sp. L-07]